MPYIIRPKKAGRRLCGALAGTLAALAVPAAAGACTLGATSQPFARYGDNASYELVEGGAFESASPGWSLESAQVVNASWSYHGTSAGGGLEIQPGGSAVSPPVCVDTEEPTFRFFMRRGSMGNSDLLVAVRWNSDGPHEIVSTISSAQLAWGPGPVLGLGSLMPTLAPNQSVTARLAFSVSGWGAWDIDDVYIDPYTR